MHWPDIEGRSVVVTGASSGIGEAIAKLFADSGAAVAVNYRSSDEEAARILDSIAAKGGRAIIAKGDISHRDECQKVFDATEHAFGRIDILIANAGIQCDKPFVDMSIDEWQRVIDVNLTGQFICAQEAVRRFRRQEQIRGSPTIGKIIFTSSVHQAIPWAGHANYAAAKGGLRMLMSTLAQELASERIRINAIAPGAIKTSINEEVWKDPQARQDLIDKIPYRRIGAPEDVAQAVLWLASDQSDYVVGTTLYVDGGMMLYPSFSEGG